MMRARAGSTEEALVFSAYQYTPRFLLFNQSVALRWRGMSLNAAQARIRDSLPEAQRPGWDDIANSSFGRARDLAREKRMDATAIWISQHGPALGFRPPNWAERARAVGLYEYLAATQLSNRERADALGNGFGQYEVASRIGHGLAEALQRDAADPRPGHPRNYPHPLTLRDWHVELTAGLLGKQTSVDAMHPFPNRPLL